MTRRPAPTGPARLTALWTLGEVATGIALANTTAPPASLAVHREAYGDLPLHHAARAAEAIRGRGGAGYPLGAKLRAVAARGRRCVVVANGAESEPGAAKDSALMIHAPHLVLDGVELAAHELGADEAIVAVEDEEAARELRRATSERGSAVCIELIPARYVSGQETAVLRALEGAPAVPHFDLERPSVRGLHGRPTLVSNVETLAQWAVAARFGSAWHQALGSRGEDRSSRLVSIRPAAARAVLAELAPGIDLGTLLAATGSPPGLALVGGLFGTLLDTRDSRARARVLVDRSHSPQELRLGAGTILLAPGAACRVCATAELVAYLAAERVGQCGPCDRGVPDLTQALHAGGGSHRDRAARNPGRGARGVRAAGCCGAPRSRSPRRRRRPARPPRARLCRAPVRPSAAWGAPCLASLASSSTPLVAGATAPALPCCRRTSRSIAGTSRS